MEQKKTKKTKKKTDHHQSRFLEAPFVCMLRMRSASLRTQIWRTIIENLKLAVNTTILENFCIQNRKYVCYYISIIFLKEKKNKYGEQDLKIEINMYHNFGPYLHSDLQIPYFLI